MDKGKLLFQKFFEAGQIQSRPRSSQVVNRSQKPQRVASAKMQQSLKKPSQLSASTAQLKVSQFSQGSMIERQKENKSSQKFFTIKLKDDNQETHLNEEYFTVTSEISQPIFMHEENLESQRVIVKPSPHQRNPSKQDQNLNLSNSKNKMKSQSSGNVLKQTNRQISPSSRKPFTNTTNITNKPFIPQNTDLPPQPSKQSSISKVLKKTVTLCETRESKEAPQKIEQVPQMPLSQDTFTSSVNQTLEEDTNMLEINKKIECVLNKYKNVSFFGPEQSYSLFEPEKQQPKVLTQRQNEQQQSTVNKYITRISRGKTFMGSVFQSQQSTNSVHKETQRIAPTQNQRRMNSPQHRRKGHESTNLSLTNRKEASSPSRAFSSKKRMQSPVRERQSQIYQFTMPFPEFNYHLSLLQFFHQTQAPFKNPIIQQKISKFYQTKQEQQYFEALYKEHFLQSFHALQFCKEIEQPQNIKIVKLPQNKFKKTIVFDLDETLIHCNESNDAPADIVLSISFPSGETIDASIKMRPYCREMLQFLSQQYEIIIFTASHECYASRVLDWIDPDKKLIHHRLFRESCVVVDDGLHIKDLRVIGNRELKDILIVDNAAYSYCFHLNNGIPIIPYYESNKDKELIYLTAYLQKILQEQDMIQANASYFQNNIFQDQTTPEGVLVKLF